MNQIRFFVRKHRNACYGCCPDSNDGIRGTPNGEGWKEATFDGKKIYIFSELIMSYDHSNMYAAIFQVSAAGTCLGCLLVGFSFLAKV